MYTNKFQLVKFFFICSVLFGSFLFVESVSAATYYVSPSGSNTSPYDIWAKAALLPSTVINYIKSDGGIGPHTINIAAGSYSDNININHANHHNLTIIGAGPNNTIITSLASDSTLRGSTADYVAIHGISFIISKADKWAFYKSSGANNWNFENCNFFSDGSHNSTLVYLDDDLISFTNCQFLSTDIGGYPLYARGNAGGIFQNCIVIPNNKNKMINSLALVSSGSWIIDRCIFAGMRYNGIYVETGTANITNSVIQGGGGLAYAFPIRSVNASVTTVNNFLIGGLDRATQWFVAADNIESTNNIMTNANSKFQTPARRGYILVNTDDREAYVSGYIFALADKLAEYGFKGTYNVLASLFNPLYYDIDEIRDLISDETLELASHGYSHTAVITDHALTVTYIGSDTNPTVEFTEDRILQFRTTEGNDDADIDTTNPSYDTLNEIITAAPAGWTITKSVTVGYVGDRAKATSLVVQGITAVPCDIDFDKSSYDTGFYKDEIIDPKAHLTETINAEGNITDPQTGNTYECRTYTVPGTYVDDASKQAVINAGYIFGRGGMLGTQQPTYVSYGTYVKMYSTGVLTSSYLGGGGGTELETRLRARALAWHAVETGAVLPVLSHDYNEITIEQWDWILDEWSKFGDSLVVTSNQIFADTVRNSGLWTDNGDGTYSRTYDNYTDYSLQYDSPLIDMGIDTDLTTDILGNPIYGTPDIGAYEYQPPFTFVADKISQTGSARLYSDGQYRMTTASSTTATANFSVTPAEGSYYATTTQYMDITIDSWLTSGTYNKQWTATSTAGDFLTHATSTIYTIGDLAPSTYYQFKLDGVASTTAIINNSQCTNGVCLSDSSGSLTFTYQGGYSTHTFALEKDVTGPSAFTLSSPDNNSSVSNRPTLSWNATSDSESGLSKYQLYSDGALNRDNISNSANSSEPVNDLSCGSHTWYVKAIDNAGNSTNSDVFTLSISCGGGIIYQPTSCSSVAYDDWQTTCVNGLQYRNIKSQSPSGCSLTSAQENDRKRQCGTSTAPDIETTPTAPTPTATSETSVSDSAGNVVWKQILNDAEIIATGDVNQLLSEVGAKRDLDAESGYSRTVVERIVKNTEASDQTRNAITNFVTYGTPTTQPLGAGERAGVVNSFKSAFGRLPTTQEDWNDVIKIANGRWPGQINKETEKNAEAAFKKIYLRNPDRTNARDDAAITVMAYGLRPANRNLDSEKAAIRIFTNIYGYSPATATAWDVVRAISYSGVTR